MANISRPPFSHSPEQKRQYPGLRSLPLYNDPSPGHPPNDGSASNSPVPNHPQQFMRGVSTPGVTQSSQGFGSSPSPSSGALYLSQSQQIQLSSNSQQLQVSQSQQQLIMSQDMKPSIAQQQQQQHVQGRGFYGGQSAVHMSQSQSVNFQFSGSSRSASPTTNQRPSPSQMNSSASGRHVQQQYMSRPPPDYQASIEPSGCNSGPINNMQSGLLSQNHQMQVNMPDNINIINDQSNRTIDHRNNTPVSVSQSYAGIIPISQSVPIPSSQSYSGSVPNSNVYSGLTHISNSPSISVSKSYPGLISISDATSVSASDKSFPGTVPISDATSVSISRPYTGIVPVSNTVLLSSSKPYQGMVPISNSTTISVSKPYPGIASLSNSSGTKIYSSMNPVSNANPVSVSKSYPGSGPISSASASQSYTGVPTSSLSEQVPTHSLMMPTTTTIAPTYSVSKGRGGSKQGNSRTFNKQCGPLRQHKAPNVNVGPEGLNISQRTMDWRHTYIQHQNQQQIVTHVNPQLRMSFPRGIAQNYGQNLGIANGNNFQVHHLNPNSPANNNSRVVTSSPIADHSLPIQQSGIHDINSSVTSHVMLQQQQQQVIINSDNNTLLSSSNTLLNSSHIQMGSSANSGGDSTSQSQQQVFSTSSPSSNNSSQGIVPDGGQFNLDFLDNLDCSTSDLLNFDVMQGGSTTFPLLEDMSMLDK
ncbi:uncharacterized threonine-rich GPI-anchored glycoprotein PJ4664.02-like [Stegodyphus dumicola]|uniref:uncharacterized threonine-rich GPI-anchored glycoprotein PJ4664.02-like n=1 Tax=Stegodyphus dumicola TaxID=202533 RepID=UPI0015AD57F3|nr:uncharacterized threonine-rich GPI-anchored glycoprotein PJ4664.02-like [Stegodyphus dumicola]